MNSKEAIKRGYLKPDPRYLAAIKQAEKNSFAMSDVTAQIRKTCYRLHIPQNAIEDAVQEGWLAYLSGLKIQPVMRKWWRKEQAYREHFLIVDPEHIEVGVFGDFNPEDLGLHYESYQGWCRDDA